MPEEMRGGPPTDIYVQLVISLIVGFSSFIGFCFLRTRWSVLYAARQKSLIGRVDLPKLPDSFFGWIPVVYHITEDQILEAAGLDAFVFLAFFKQASRFLLCAFILGLTILTPVHNAFPEAEPIASNNTNGSTSTRSPMNLWGIDTAGLDSASSLDEEKKPKLGIMTNDSYLWMYPIFVYLFSLLALYFLVQETRKIIHVRQRYLGGQSTVTDRTIRLTGIPEDFRTEEKIKDFIEELQIGKVDRVTLCRDWSELDGLVDERMRLLRKLEEAWTVHLGTAQVEENGNEREVAHLDRTDEEDEEAGLLANGSSGQAHIQPYARTRPTVKLRYGFFGMQTRSVDSIDYYEEKVKNIDEQIRDARKKEYKPVSLAFVTLDSVAACQMAIQAKLDPSPLTLLAAPAPAPPDVIWPNTYQSRRERLVRGWTITTFIALLTIFFTTVSVPLAGLINLEAIKRATPQFGHFLDTHYITRNLVQSTLPTVILSLLNVAVPYIYDWLSTYQGFIAGGDTEISSIAKNYIFVYFNSFLVFTIVGSGVEIYQDIKNALLDTSIIFYRFANSLSILAKTYTNFILLQGVALAPFRALEIGAVFCYPIGLVGARTPRDFAELARPPLYKYSLT